MRPNRRSGHPRALHLTVQFALMVWSMVWLGLVAAFAQGEPWLPAIGFAIPLLSIAALAWCRPLAGGILAVGAGVFAMFFFDHAFPRAWLATPAILLGTMLIWTSCHRAPVESGQ